MSVDMYKNLAQAIIEEQAVVIGDIAWREAEKVTGLTLEGKHVASILEDGAAVLSRLVAQYERLFGRASVEVCRNALHPFADALKGLALPAVLQ